MKKVLVTLALASLMFVSCSKGISDETFAEVSSVYSELSALYTSVAEYHQEGLLDLNEEQIAIFNEAAALINEIGEIEKSEIKSDEDAITLIETMGSLAEGLGYMIQ